MALRVFPPTVTQPRKSSLKKARSFDPSNNAADVKGVAFQVNTTHTSPAVVQAGNQHVKHSLHGDPSTAQSSSSRLGSLRKPRRASTQLSVALDKSLIRCDSPLHDGEEDQLSPLPENKTFGSPSSHTRLSPGVERPALPLTISTEAQPGTDVAASPGGDGLSALPDRDRFAAISPSRAEFAATRSLYSTSPTLIPGDSPASTVPPYTPRDPEPSRSIFPAWDPTKPLDQQQYYPRGRSASPNLTPQKISKAASPRDKKHLLPPLDLQLVEPTATVVVGYEHVPVANSSDLLEVFNASCDRAPVAGRKALFRLIQPRGKGTALGIGVSEESVLWSMKKEETQSSSSREPESSDQLVISKHAPTKAETSRIAQLALPSPGSENGDEAVNIFPHKAAIDAIETMATSAAGAAVAKVDPNAKSAEAARLAQNAVADASRRCQCRLVRTTRQRDGLGAVTAAYQLEHPTLGLFAITVTKSTEGRHSRDPRAKISLHHPSATPAAISAETLVLAFLDFARDACVLDVPGLQALEGSYIIDTVVCALLAVSIIENDALLAQTMTFDAPPTSPLPLAKNTSRGEKRRSTQAVDKSKQSKGLFKRKQKKKKEELDLPILTQGALALLGLSFKVAVWTLELGVKATAGVIITTSHVVSSK